VLEDEVSLRDPEDSILLIATSSSNMRLALDFLAKELNFQYNIKCPYGVLERQIKNTIFLEQKLRKRLFFNVFKTKVSDFVSNLNVKSYEASYVSLKLAISGFTPKIFFSF
jgi:hypothetical protein